MFPHLTILLALSVCLTVSVGCDRSGDEVDNEAVAPVETVEQWLAARSTGVSNAGDLEPLVEAAGQRPLVLLGEASHGTREFYEWRADLSLEIADGQGLDFVGIEGDWHAARAADRYVMGDGDVDDVEALLQEAFERWPQWMWANEEMASFLRRARAHNEANPQRPIRIYGIDMHGFFESLARLVELVERHHPQRATEMATYLRCLARFAPEGQRYMATIQSDPQRHCQSDTEQAVELTHRLFDGDDVASLSARKHARVVASGEAQYRKRVQEGGAAFWNVRATHFYETVEALMQFHGPDARGVVWAHNTHIGDARATDMSDRGRVNIGQLARQSMGDDAVLAVGFSTYEGSVIAGRQWGQPLEAMTVPEAPVDSVDEMLNRGDHSPFLAFFEPGDEELPFWRQRPGQRAIGVVYHPERENPGNYVPTNPAQRYDALIFIDETTTLRPL